MPRLEWIGKDKVVNHHMEVPFHVLEHKYGFDESGMHEERMDSGNMIIHGDNLVALKSLLPQFEGKIKCIYIDPPYNTGNEKWCYNDNVNDPRIKKWLGQVVGKEGEDMSRHDKWLCMMYPRLRLLQQLLKDEGVILISIDDNEYSNLKSICDEIFGISNFIASCVWQGSKKGDAKFIASCHEYILIYAKNKQYLVQEGVMWRCKKNGIDQVFSHYQALKNKHGNNHEAIRKDMQSWYKSLPADNPAKAHKHYSWSDERGLYFPDNFAGPNDGRLNRPRYDIIHPITGMPCKKPSTGWRWEEGRTIEALAANPPRIHFGPTHKTIPCRKSYLAEVSEEPFSSVFYKDGRGASKLVDNLIGKGKFDFPKDINVLQNLLGMITSEGDIVLDSFAGSGSTAHAVLKLNKESTSTRKFILIELSDYAENTTAYRVKRAIEGTVKMPGLWGSFDFYEIGERLFNDEGNISPQVPINEVKKYIYFMETKESIHDDGCIKDTAYLGTNNGTAYYLFYMLDSVSCLNHDLLAKINVKAELYVIYADTCQLSRQELDKYNITFKKIPRDITKL